ncbi:MAG TPA: penicillin-binding transpeptidase domain-containing protein [Acidimicrobiia bacterium]|nr:penicillin-binding transpeptidase domain-containing protein [Acidimicrobiia bacterium]
MPDRGNVTTGAAGRPARSGGYPAHERRRRPPHAVIVALCAVAVVAVVSVGVAVTRSDPGVEEAVRDVRRSVDEYLSAWQQRDVPRMRELVAAPDHLPAPYIEEFAGLPVTDVRFEAKGVTVTGDEAEARFAARVQVEGLGLWAYRGRLPLEREPARWVVDWSPAAFHPALRDGLRLGETREELPRAPILGVDGNPLPSLAALGTDVSGLQAAFDAQLAGQPAGAVQVLDASGNVVRTLARFEQRAAPEPVATTLDPAVQAAAEAALADTVQPAALVAVDVATGDVRAVVSRPGGGFARALLGRYPPGSTFKVVTTTAALAAGITPEEVIDCPPSVDPGGKVFVNAKGEALGPIPLTVAFAQSCNTAFVNLAGRLTDSQLQEAAADYGFGADTDLGLASFGGSFPLPSGPIEHAAAALGQARVETSPLKMAEVAAAVAGGAWRPARLLAEAPAGKSRPLDPTVTASLQQMMRLAVTEGTGTAADLPGSPVHGKTGTAEFGTETPPRTHAWFIGYRDNLAFAVLVEDTGFGGDVAAPIAARFLSAL